MRGRLIFALAWLALSAFVGCAARPSLPAESAVPWLAALDTAYRALPEHTALVPAGDAGGKPIRLQVQEVGAGDANRLVVMIHGLISDMRSWRFVAGDLGADHHLMLIDLPGCGHSDAPDPAVVGEPYYEPASLARAVLTVLRQRLPDYPPGVKIALVGHSLGGAVVLRAVSNPDLRKEFADVLAHVDRAVMLAPADADIGVPHPAFVALMNASRCSIELGALTGILEDRIVRAVTGNSHGHARMPMEEVDHIVEVLRDPARFGAAKAMVREASPNHDMHHDWPAIESIVSQYPNIGVPCLILWGEHDTFLPAAIGYKLVLEIPGAHLRVFKGRNHFLPTEAPKAVATLIRRFTQDTPDPGPATPLVVTLDPYVEPLAP